MRLYSNNSIASNNSVKQPVMIMSMFRTQPPKNIQQNQPIIESLNKPNPIAKVKWGPPVWYLFHTLSVKIKDSEFKYIRTELLNNTYAICCNLPCPDCANHAKTYLDGINFNSIQTKEDYKRMMFNFHNSVNKRKGYPQFSYDEIDTKYSLAITKNIIQHFMMHFQDRNRSIKLIASDLHRSQLSVLLKQWFNSVIYSFDP